jgi:ABC-2 type transport system ATP-binding protein
MTDIPAASSTASGNAAEQAVTEVVASVASVPVAATDAAPAASAVHIAPKPPAVSTFELTKRYNTLTALDRLTLELEPGDIFGFIGPNGAGKSTTMKILAGLLEPTSGRASVMGKPVVGNGDFVRRNIGYMPDFIGVYDDLTVTEYLDFFASAYGVPRGQRRSVVEQVLELTDLSYKRDAMVEALSRGMTQRLSLARVLVHDPPVLLLDEPASGLDPRARIEIRELIRELQRLGKTILISSHILSELGEFCNKLGIIERGRLIASGTVDELIARARAGASVVVTVLQNADVAMAALRADPRIDDADLTALPAGSTPRPGSAAIQVTLRDPSAHHGFIAERLVSAGVVIDSIHPEQLKLEEVFLRLTKGLVQ